MRVIVCSCFKEAIVESSSVPISTGWLLDAVSETSRSAVNAVYMVTCPQAQKKGTGFLLRAGALVTNWHVICHCEAAIRTNQSCRCDPPSLLADIVAVSSNGQKNHFKHLVFDQHKDLAILEPSSALPGGLNVKEAAGLSIGQQVCTWGHPLGYDGPAPILTVGWLSGFVASSEPPVKHFVVNAAFNPGNSGGPLLVAGEDSVIGVVVSKHAPISPWLVAIFNALENQQSGFTYTATDPQGNQRQFSEAQLVAEVLLYFRQMTQVVLGEAIAGEELIAFLKANGVCPN